MNDKNFERIKKRRVSKFKNILKEIYPNINFISVDVVENPWIFDIDHIVRVRALVNNKDIGSSYNLNMKMDEKFFDKKLKKDKKAIKRNLRKLFLNDRKKRRLICKDKSCYRFLANHYTYKENKSESKISKIKRKM